jgi:chorismate mutase/prephenate dehydratase
VTKLEEARSIINRIDREMAQLFCERMDAARMVAEYKRETGMPIFDPEREAEVIRKNTALLDRDEFRSYYIDYLQNMMDLSKRYQKRLLDGRRIAYSGVKGAFAWIAAERIFPAGTTVPYPDFKSAYDAVEKGECDCAVLPIENSYQGDVAQVMDMAFAGSLYINGVYDLEVTQNLLALPGTRLSDITEVISHPQALGQCAGYLRAHGIKATEATNTAIAAQTVAEMGRRDLGAIASRETAALYGLEIIEKEINESRNNTTRFAVFSRTPSAISPADNHFIMFFTVRNEAGALGRAISVIGQNGYNLRALKSRPTKDNNWEYYFYVEGEGNIHAPNGQQMLEWLQMACSNVKVVGSFISEKKLVEKKDYED